MMIDAGEITPERRRAIPSATRSSAAWAASCRRRSPSGASSRCETGDAIVLSTDGFWAQIPPTPRQHAAQADAGRAHAGPPRRGAPPRARRIDNLSVVAMTWENQDDARVADTQSMETRIRHLVQHHAAARAPGTVDDVTEEDIERAISEIQDAIRKVPR
jgi:hypothetical protein